MYDHAGIKKGGTENAGKVKCIDISEEGLEGKTMSADVKKSVHGERVIWSVVYELQTCMIINEAERRCRLR